MNEPHESNLLYQLGEINATLRDVNRRLDQIERSSSTSRSGHAVDRDKLYAEMSDMKIQAAKMAGFFSLVGGGLGGSLTAIAYKILGG